MELENQTMAQMRAKREALARALPLPNMEPDLAYQTKEFTRKAKSGILARPNHLGDSLKVVLPGDF